jgi:hypothetical protein
MLESGSPATAGSVSPGGADSFFDNPLGRVGFMKRSGGRS